MIGPHRWDYPLTPSRGLAQVVGPAPAGPRALVACPRAAGAGPAEGQGGGLEVHMAGA